MKKFLKCFVAAVQFLLGAVFAAAVTLSVLGVYDIMPDLSGGTVKYIVLGVAALYVVFSAVVIVLAVGSRRITKVRVSNDDGYVTRYPASKIKALGKEAAAAVGGLKFKGLFIVSRADGYCVKAKLQVTDRTASEAVKKFTATFAELCETVVGIAFAGIDVYVGKITGGMSGAEAKAGALARQEQDTEAAEEREPEYGYANNYGYDAYAETESGAESAEQTSEEPFEPAIEEVSYTEAYDSEEVPPPPLTEEPPVINPVEDESQEEETAPAAKTSAAKASAAKTTAKKPASKTSAAKKPASKTSAAKTSAAKAPAKKPASAKASAALAGIPDDDRPPFDL